MSTTSTAQSTNLKHNVGVTNNDNAATNQTGAAAAGLSTLRFCTAGSVDDGKSTFVGRLLHDTGNVAQDQLDSVAATSAQRGVEGLDFSLLVDGLRAEREQGITIDVAYRYFHTDQRAFILADTPGHVQYTRNTVTGISTSDLVVLLVDSRNGLTAQTLKHLSIAALLGVQHLVLAVNKIDAVVDPESTYTNIATEFSALAQQHGIANVWVVPTSALHGDNVAQRSTKYPFYTGPSVLDILNTVEIAPASGDFRFPVQRVIREHASDYRGYAGRITVGRIAVGDVVATASGQSTVAGIDTADGPVEEAVAGNSIVLRLADNLDIARGDLIAGAQFPAAVRQAQVTAVGLSETPLQAGAVVKLRYGTADVKAKVTQVGHDGAASAGEGLTVNSSADSAIGAVNKLGLNDIATVELLLAQPLPLEPYASRGAVGSLLLVDPVSGDTRAAALVDVAGQST